MLTAIQEMWKRELGITITVTPLEQKTWIQNWQSYAYQASTERWIGDYVDPSTYLDMWTTDNPNNLTGWSNAAYDHLIAESDRTLDTPKRQALQRQAETILLDEAPIIPIVYGARVFLIHPAVKNWIPNILGLHRYQYIGLQ
jgi:oligopeptide transport system substrate-binding protein